MMYGVSEIEEQLRLTPVQYYLLVTACAHGAAAHTGEEKAEYMNVGSALIKGAEIAKKRGHTEFMITSA
jgi:hypothetical protein